MTRTMEVYLRYLLQAANSGLPPDGRKFDWPCPQFKHAAERLVRLGLARRRWWLFGPVGITQAGIDAIGLMDVSVHSPRTWEGRIG